MKLREQMAERLKLPKDLVMGAAVLTVTGRSEAYIENYRGIIEYTEQKIRLQTKTCQMTLCGERLHIDYYTEDEMKISGEIGEIIILWGLRSVGTEYEMCISISGFRRLRPLVHKTKTKAVILERHGLPFILHRYKNRKLFAIGAVSCIGLLYALSLFIWNIHVEGNYSLSDQVVLEYLESEQIVHGMAKKDVHGEIIEAKLREHFPEITWTSAEVKGTRLIIHVQENEDVAFERISSPPGPARLFP